MSANSGKSAKRALVKSHRQHLRRSNKSIDAEETMALVKPSGKHLRQSQCARPREKGGYSCYQYSKRFGLNWIFLVKSRFCEILVAR